MELPLKLRTAIENELSKFQPGILAKAAVSLSKSYRTGLSKKSSTFSLTQEDIYAYAAYRLPATYAAIYSVLSHVKTRLPYLAVESLLDVGAGPGTVMWAAAEIWSELEHVTLVERDSQMIDLGKKLSAYSGLPQIKNSAWLKADITGSWNTSPHSIVTASYVLNELPEHSYEAFIRRLWDSVDSVLIIIEPGTPAGFSRLKYVRQLLISLGAATIAPCPHNSVCPIKEDDWCHFSQRVSRSKLHRMIKSGELSYEDEKFSFICMSKDSATDIKGVVIRHPQIRKGHIQLKLCTPAGLTDSIVTRKDKEAFRKARKLQWGSIVP